MSQDDLAALTGHERRSIQRYENAVRDPRYSDLLLIARAFDMPVSELLAEP